LIQVSKAGRRRSAFCFSAAKEVFAYALALIPARDIIAAVHLSGSNKKYAPAIILLWFGRVSRGFIRTRARALRRTFRYGAVGPIVAARKLKKKII
jgi:hypothetical protein